MKETHLTTLQNLVSPYLIRHRSFLDVQSKLSETTARISRAMAHAVATCGCVQIHAEKGRRSTPKADPLVSLISPAGPPPLRPRWRRG